jgi:hypothetical protein
MAPARSYISFLRLGLAVFIYRNCATSAKMAAHVSSPFVLHLSIAMTRAHEAHVAVAVVGPGRELRSTGRVGMLHCFCKFGTVLRQIRR